LGFLAVCGCLAAVTILVTIAYRNERQMGKNVGHRFTQGEKALKFWSQSPLFGVGIGTFEFVDREMQPLVPYLAAVRHAGRPISGSQIEIGEHSTNAGQPPFNGYLKVLLDFGLIGLGLYAAWYWQALRRGREVSSFQAAGRPDLALLRDYALFNSTVVALS